MIISRWLRQRQERLAAKAERNFHDAQTVIRENLSRQLDAFGYAPGTIPDTVTFSGPYARGVLYGLVIGIIAAERCNPSYAQDCLVTAFSFVYGEETGHNLARRTFYDVQNNDPEVILGEELALRDLQKHLSNKEYRSSMVFCRILKD